MYNDLYIVASKINVKPYMGLTHFSHKYDTKFHTYIRNILFLGFLKTLQIASVWQHIRVLSSFFFMRKAEHKKCFLFRLSIKGKKCRQLGTGNSKPCERKRKKKGKKEFTK